MAHRILTTRSIPGDILRRAESFALASGISVVFDCIDKLPLPREVLLRHVQGASGLICTVAESIDNEVLAAAGPSLRVVSTISVGTSHIDAAACAAANIRVGYTPGVLTDATADLVLALTLAAARRIPEAAESVRTGEWKTWSPFWLVGKDVWGSTVGIIGGSGRIGSAVARRFHGGFDCKVLYSNRSGPVSDFDSAHAAQWLPLEELLSRSDIVIVLCALTPDTRHLINRARLELMKHDALFINASRGEVVDQAALAAVLRERPSMKAGLDVTTPEPLPLDSELLSLPNCLVLPHIGSATEGARSEMVRIALENAVTALAGIRMVAELMPVSNLL
jgi:lactate dehydrogenase-like 2-hydroxyacid dehydrogenase